MARGAQRSPFIVGERSPASNWVGKGLQSGCYCQRGVMTVKWLHLVAHSLVLRCYFHPRQVLRRCRNGHIRSIPKPNISLQRNICRDGQEHFYSQRAYFLGSAHAPTAFAHAAATELPFVFDGEPIPTPASGSHARSDIP